MLNSLSENREVGSKVTGGQGTWIGLYRDPKDTSRWLWIDRSRQTYTHWRVGEPNNSGIRKDCVFMGTRATSYTWKNSPCSNNNPYVCETTGKSGGVMLYILQ